MNNMDATKKAPCILYLRLQFLTDLFLTDLMMKLGESESADNRGKFSDSVTVFPFPV